MVGDESDWQQLTLADGRELGFATYGPEHGVPVLHHHGTPGSRLATFEDTDLNAHGVRVIVADRPGFGRSSPIGGERGFLEWADDTAELVDALGIERFGASGHSGGGPFALACAQALGDRVTHVAVIAGAGRLCDPDVASSLPAPFDDAVRAARDDPDALRDFLRATTSPETIVELIVGRPGPDQALYADVAFLDDFRRSVAEALRQGPEAYIEEFVALLRPWDIDLRSVTVPTSFWYGDLDANPLHQPYMGRRLADEVGGEATFNLVPDAGGELPHYPVAGQILTTLAEAAA